MKEEELFDGEPYDVYYGVAWMKRYTETLCRLYSEKLKDKKMPCVVLRPSNIYGPYDDFEWETSHVIPALIRKAVEKQDPLEVWGDGNNIKDLIYIDDFIDALLLAMEKIDSFDPINIGSGIPTSIRQALQFILEAANYEKAHVIFNPSKPSLISQRLIDVSKAQKVLGFSTKHSLKEGIRKTVTWYKEKRNLL